MPTDTTATDFVKPQFSEAIKTHSVYDGSERLIEFYTAMANTGNGGKCILTKYTYIGVSTRVENTSEVEGTWDSTWDIP
jgi:hypothetical protein